MSCRHIVHGAGWSQSFMCFIILGCTTTAIFSWATPKNCLIDWFFHNLLMHNSCAHCCFSCTCWYSVYSKLYTNLNSLLSVKMVFISFIYISLYTFHLYIYILYFYCISFLELCAVGRVCTNKTQTYKYKPSLHYNNSLHHEVSTLHGQHLNTVFKSNGHSAWAPTVCSVLV